MGFWDLSDGTSAKDTGKTYEAPETNFEPIPDNTRVMAEIEEAGWASMQDGSGRHVALKWRILDPEQYANRVIFQKLWVGDDDPYAKSADAAEKKRNKSLTVLAAIDANCGGKLARIDDDPDDSDLAMSLQGKPMSILLRVWEMKGSDGETRTGNWIAGVGEGKGGNEKPKAAPKSSGGKSKPVDDDVPF